MAQIYVRPAAGRTARHEVTHRPLPVRGQWWEDNAYTRRLLRNGDVVVATAPGSVPPASARPANQVAVPVGIAKAPPPTMQSKIEAARAELVAEAKPSPQKPRKRTH